MKTFCQILMIPALALAVAGAAQAKPTQAEIDAARAECAEHKQLVKTLESGSSSEDPGVVEERRAWELACARAQALMDEKTGTRPPQPRPVAIGSTESMETTASSSDAKAVKSLACPK